MGIKDWFTKSPQREVLDLGALLQGKLGACPPDQVETRQCVCMSCPQKGTCTIERVHRVAGCSNLYVRACSNRLVQLGKSDVTNMFDTYLAQFFTKFLKPDMVPTHGKEE